MPLQALALLWLQPRAAYRLVMASRPGNSSVLLYVVAWYLSWFEHWLASAMPSLVVAMVVILLPVFAVLLLYFQGWVLRQVGRWLDGSGDPLGARVAISWGGVPVTLATLFGIIGYFFWGEQLLWIEQMQWPDNPLVLLVSLLPLVFGIYSLFTTSIMLGEANGFSAWRGLATLLLSLVLILIAAAFLAVLVSMLVLLLR